MEIEKINLRNKLSFINDYWDPGIVGELNNQFVKLVKAKGEFDWHKHENEDEMFYVVEGSFQMEMKNKTQTIEAGEFIIIPRGVLHRPVAREEVHLMLFEPKSTLNTGDNHDSKLTKENLKWI